MKNLLIFVVVVAVLGVGGWFAYQQYVVPAQTQAQEPAYETVQVEQGPIGSTVNATGSIEPEAEVSLFFRTVGPVHNPLLLILDDLQWTDSASAGLLFHLGRRISGSRGGRGDVEERLHGQLALAAGPAAFHAFDCWGIEDQQVHTGALRAKVGVAAHGVASTNRSSLSWSV